MSFPIKIKSEYLGKIKIEKGQYWVCHCDDTQRANDFLNWIEGKKFIRTESVSFLNEGKECDNLYKLQKHIEILRFRPIKKQSGTYYQQRYHSTENDDLIPLSEFIGDVEENFYKDIAVKLDLNKLLGEKLNMLSTGEFKKSMILKAMMSKPSLLLVEEPGLGVDQDSRLQLHELFEHLTQGVSSVVVFSYTNSWPYKGSNQLELSSGKQFESIDLNEIPMPRLCDDTDYKFVFNLKNIVARYNGRNVLNNINWKVAKNSKWALTGKNGAGKSTLLSFVYADNPQSYSNEVYLFEQKRGVGHSIWDIKERIGYYSPEYQRYIDQRQRVETVIQRTALQNPYKKRNLNSDQELFKQHILSYFNIEHLTNNWFYELSPVIQRIVILCGVLIKNAPLLILDEPFQGFNQGLVEKAQLLIDKYAANRTLIMVSHNNKNFPKSINQRFHLTNGVGEEVECDL